MGRCESTAAEQEIPTFRLTISPEAADDLKEISLDMVEEMKVHPMTLEDNITRHYLHDDESEDAMSASVACVAEVLGGIVIESRRSLFGYSWDVSVNDHRIVFVHDTTYGNSFY